MFYIELLEHNGEWVRPDLLGYLSEEPARAFADQLLNVYGYGERYAAYRVAKLER